MGQGVGLFPIAIGVEFDYMEGIFVGTHCTGVADDADFGVDQRGWHLRGAGRDDRTRVQVSPGRQAVDALIEACCHGCLHAGFHVQLLA